jgi:hypothetical protein
VDEIYNYVLGAKVHSLFSPWNELTDRTRLLKKPRRQEAKLTLLPMASRLPCPVPKPEYRFLFSILFPVFV